MTDLARVTDLAEILVDQKAVVEELEKQLAAAKASMYRLEREDLPALMNEIGLTEIKLSSGKVITIKEDCDVKLTAERKEAGLKWLIDNGYGGLIKTAVAIEFGRGEHDEALHAKALLEKDFGQVQLDENVHHSTLKAFVKERMAAGEAIPLDLFGVYAYSKAVVK